MFPGGQWTVQCLIHFSSLSLIVFTLFVPGLKLLWMFYSFSLGVNACLQGPLNTILPFINNRAYVCRKYTLFAWFVHNYSVLRWHDCAVTMQPPVVIKGETMKKRGEERRREEVKDVFFLSHLQMACTVKDPGLFVNTSLCVSVVSN